MVTEHVLVGPAGTSKLMETDACPKPAELTVALRGGVLGAQSGTTDQVTELTWIGVAPPTESEPSKITGGCANSVSVNLGCCTGGGSKRLRVKG